jgi:hypothetical protein
MGLTDRFEFATARDPSRNYCLWEYEPPAPPEDKFRAINVLYQSFALARLDERAYAMIDAVRDAIGSFKTVFGVKLIDGQYAWEFYFYDYKRRAREVSITRVLDAIRPFMPCAVVPNEALPYFMFSLDLNQALITGRAIDVVHMYVGNPGNTVSSGIAYAIRADTTTLENFYFFFDAKTQMSQVQGKVESSAVFDASAVSLDRVLVPELCRCQTICVANKQTHDCIYFSGVDVDQLLFFLEFAFYPTETIDWVRQERHQLSHLLFDVGFDYRSDINGLKILKSGYYGVV